MTERQRACRERPRGYTAAEKRDELPPPHWLILSFPKIISGRNGGASRTRLGWRQWRRTAGLPYPAACFYPGQVRTDLIVIRRIKRKNLPQVRFAKDQHPVQALATHGANQTLHVRILPRRSRRDRSVADAHCPHA